MATQDVYRLTVLGRLHNQRIIQVHHYRQTTTEPGDNSAQLTAAWRVANEPSLLACLSNEYSQEGYLTQRIHPLPVNAAYELPTPSLNGSVVVSSLPSSVAAVTTKRTLFAGPKYRGRNYYAGVPTTHELDSKLTASAMNLWGTYASNLEVPLVSLGGISFTPVLFHRSTSTNTTVFTCIARDILRNQRRRQVGRGE